MVETTALRRVLLNGQSVLLFLCLMHVDPSFCGGPTPRNFYDPLHPGGTRDPSCPLLTYPHLTIQCADHTRDPEAEFLLKPVDPQRPKILAMGLPLGAKSIWHLRSETQGVTEMKPGQGTCARVGQGHSALGLGSQRPGWLGTDVTSTSTTTPLEVFPCATVRAAGNGSFLLMV